MVTNTKVTHVKKAHTSVPSEHRGTDAATDGQSESLLAVTHSAVDRVQIQKDSPPQAMILMMQMMTGHAIAMVTAWTLIVSMKKTCDRRFDWVRVRDDDDDRLMLHRASTNPDGLLVESKLFLDHKGRVQRERYLDCGTSESVTVSALQHHRRRRCLYVNVDVRVQDIGREEHDRRETLRVTRVLGDPAVGSLAEHQHERLAREPQTRHGFEVQDQEHVHEHEARVHERERASRYRHEHIYETCACGSLPRAAIGPAYVCMMLL